MICNNRKTSCHNTKSSLCILLHMFFCQTCTRIHTNVLFNFKLHRNKTYLPLLTKQIVLYWHKFDFRLTCFPGFYMMNITVIVNFRTQSERGCPLFSLLSRASHIMPSIIVLVEVKMDAHFNSLNLIRVYTVCHSVCIFWMLYCMSHVTRKPASGFATR